METKRSGVPFVAQGVKNRTQCPEEAASMPSLTQWVKHPALLQAAAVVTDAPPIWHCGGCDVSQQLQLQFDLQPRNVHMPKCVALKRKRKKKRSIHWMYRQQTRYNKGKKLITLKTSE